MPMTGKPIDLNIERWKREGIVLGARAMLVVWDQFPWPPEAYPVFIAPGDSITQRFAALDGHGMQLVCSVHLFAPHVV
jgi:hypothetical protein